MSGRNKGRRVADFDGLAMAIAKDRELRLNLIGCIVDATRAEWQRRNELGRGAVLVAEEGKALAALEVELRDSFRRLDEAAHRVSLWSASITTGDARGWGFDV